MIINGIIAGDLDGVQKRYWLKSSRIYAGAGFRRRLISLKKARVFGFHSPSSDTILRFVVRERSQEIVGLKSCKNKETSFEFLVGPLDIYPHIPACQSKIRSLDWLLISLPRHKSLHPVLLPLEKKTKTVWSFSRVLLLTCIKFFHGFLCRLVDAHAGVWIAYAVVKRIFRANVAVITAAFAICERVWSPKMGRRVSRRSSRGRRRYRNGDLEWHSSRRLDWRSSRKDKL